MRQGLPIGGQMLLEFGAFATMQIFAGRCGTTEAAGHAIIQARRDSARLAPVGSASRPRSFARCTPFLSRPFGSFPPSRARASYRVVSCRVARLSAQGPSRTISTRLDARLSTPSD
jgi:hypothetical protein